MYYYILDPQNIDPQKFEQRQIELQGYLAEFKISGEMGRVTSLRTIADLVETASERGVKTLVACGSDDTFNQMLAALKGRDFILGFIPFDEHSFLAKILGVPDVFTGVKTIAARRLERIDLAKIAGNYFINYLEFGALSQNLKTVGFWSGMKFLSTQAKNLVARIDDSYNINLPALGGLVVNIRSSSSQGQNIANPTDGNLDLLILEPLNRMQILTYRKDIAEGLLEKVPNTTVIKCKKIEFLEPRGTTITMLGRLVAKFPSTVEIIPQRLRMIVGKNRTF